MEITDTGLSDQFEEMARDAAQADAERWRDEAQVELRRAGERLDWAVGSVLDTFSHVHWSESKQAYVFGVSHEAAGFMEHGTEPHLIEADQADSLAFLSDGETVFAQSVNHPGTPAIRFLSKGRDRVVNQE